MISSCQYVLKVIVGPRGVAGFPFVFALPSFLLLALATKRDPRPPVDALLTLYRGGSHEEPTTFHIHCGQTLAAVGVSFHSSLQFLTCLWCFLFLHLHFADIYLPSSFYNWVLIPIISSFSNNTHSVLCSWLDLFKATTEEYFQIELLKNTTFFTQNFLSLEIVLILRVCFLPLTSW